MSEITTKILEAGLEAFRDHGFKGASLSAIADLAGVSRPTIYARFENKEALFVEVTRHVFDACIAQARDVLAQGLPLEETLSGALDAYFGRLYDELLGFDRSDEILHTWSLLCQDVFTAAHQEMRALLLGALERSGAPDPEATAELLMLAPRGFKGPDVDATLYRARLTSLARLVARAAET